MPDFSRKQSPRRVVLAVATAMLAVVPASQAAEYCVTCAGPAAMYACSVEGQPADAPIDPRMQLLCIQELAQQGGHETCSVPRSAPQPCPGVLRTVAVPADAPSVRPPAAVTTENERLESSEAAKDPVKSSVPLGDPAKPPRTVEEMAKQTVEASKNTIKKAGETMTGTAEKAGSTVEKAGSAVGTAAKKTWHCLTSFFSDC